MESKMKVPAKPSEGTRSMPGKTNDCDSAIKDAKKYTPEAVREAKEVKGATIKSIDNQIGDGGNNPRAMKEPSMIKRDKNQGADKVVK